MLPTYNDCPFTNCSYQAHDHARAASVATQSADTTVAINEHALAAGEFAKAASGTSSAEALRTLRLLEQHHQRLSELLRYPTEHPVAAPPTETEVKTVSEKPISTSAAVAELRASKSDLGPRSLSPLRPSSLQTPRRLPPRDLSSSIASNLASARGIRSNYTRQPLSPGVSTHQALGSLEVPARRESKRNKVPASIPEHPSKPSWVPPQPGQKKAEPQTGTSRTSAVAEPVSPTATAHEEGFSRFYNAFENILYKLSAPLAFAGLPLISEESTATQASEAATTKKTKSRSSERTEPEPDLTKYISRAALRATARDGHSGNDSFYVVPTTGHTVSYAHILSFAEKEKRRLAASMHVENPELFADITEEDEYVDARETPLPSSPSLSRKSSRRKPSGNSDMAIKVEELVIENKSLKDCVDKLSSRLHAFEMSAQNSSMALQQSMRLMRPVSLSPTRDRDSGSRNSEFLTRRVQELEEQMMASGRDIEKLSKENQKLMSVVERYRERWEKLKVGAKAKREGSLNKDTATASGTGMGTAKDTQSNKDKDVKDPTGGRFLAG